MGLSISIKVNMRTPMLKHRAIVVAVPLLLVGCSAAPSQNILGSYFPSWMVCVLIGLGLSAVVHWILLKLDMEKELPAPIMVHLAIHDCLFLCRVASMAGLGGTIR